MCLIHPEGINKGRMGIGVGALSAPQDLGHGPEHNGLRCPASHSPRFPSVVKKALSVQLKQTGKLWDARQSGEGEETAPGTALDAVLRPVHYGSRLAS